MPQVFFVGEDVTGYFPDREPVMFREKSEAEAYRDHRVEAITQELGWGDEGEIKKDGDNVFITHTGEHIEPSEWVILISLVEMDLNDDAIEAYHSAQAAS